RAGPGGAARPPRRPDGRLRPLERRGAAGAPAPPGSRLKRGPGGIARLPGRLRWGKILGDAVAARGGPVAMSLQRAWSRRPRVSIGQVMASVLAVALALGLLVPTAEPTLRARGRAVLDTLLILPAGLTLILALTAGTGPRRRS